MLPPENQGVNVSCHCYSNHRRHRALGAAPRLSSPPHSRTANGCSWFDAQRAGVPVRTRSIIAPYASGEARSRGRLSWHGEQTRTASDNLPPSQLTSCTTAMRQEGAHRLIFDQPLRFAPRTPCDQIQASSGLSESCPKNADVPKSPFPCSGSPGAVGRHISIRKSTLASYRGCRWLPQSARSRAYRFFK